MAWWREVVSHPLTHTRYNLAAEIDPRNTGVLVVYLQGGGGSGGGRTRDAGGLVDQMQRGNQDCVIM